MPTRIKETVLDKVIKDKVLIAKIAVAVNRSTQTIEEWTKSGSPYCTLRDYYVTVQEHLGLTDKETFEKIEKKQRA